MGSRSTRSIYQIIAVFIPALGSNHIGKSEKQATRVSFFHFKENYFLSRIDLLDLNRRVALVKFDDSISFWNTEILALPYAVGSILSYLFYLGSYAL